MSRDCFSRLFQHSSAVFKRENRTEGKRAGARDGDRKARESGVYQQAARSIWGEEYVQSREPSLSLRTCVHPCLSPRISSLEDIAARRRV